MKPEITPGSGHSRRLTAAVLAGVGCVVCALLWVITAAVAPGGPSGAGGATPRAGGATPRAIAAAPRAGPTKPPYALTELTFHFVDTSRPTVAFGTELSPHRALTTEVWVPDAPGRRPLVVFAAGFKVGPTPYRALLTAWARDGYIVAAPEFPLTDAAVAGAYLDEADLANQPADVRFVTDALVAPGSPLASVIDPARVAVAGHSDGGEAILSAAIRAAPRGEPVYRAVIAMSTQPIPGLGATPNPPILVTQGGVDTINPPGNGIQTWRQATSPKYLEVLHGAGHLSPLEAGSPWLPTVARVTETFLDAYVAHDGTTAAILAAGNAPPLARISSG